MNAGWTVRVKDDAPVGCVTPVRESKRSNVKTSRSKGQGSKGQVHEVKCQIVEVDRRSKKTETVEFHNCLKGSRYMYPVCKQTIAQFCATFVCVFVLLNVYMRWRTR